MDKRSSPLFPQHLKPAKEAVLPDKSLPTGKGEIARAACTVKSAIRPLSGLALRQSEEPYLLPIMPSAWASKLALEGEATSAKGCAHVT